MPFASRVGAIALVLQQVGHRDHALIQDAQITCTPNMRLRNGFAHVANAIQMVVDAGEQHRARGRARSSDVEI